MPASTPMSDPTRPGPDELREKIRAYSGMEPPRTIELVADTSNMMNIFRGHVLDLEDRFFYVLGDVREPRFGLEESVKSWVKRAIDLQTGERKIIKLVFHEEFFTNIGPIRMRCFRSPEKESLVLDLVHEDTRFMRGYTLRDTRRNPVRVIDFIHGPTLYDWILDLETSHEEYFHGILFDVLRNVRGCMEALQSLHDAGQCHGDVRNDHILIETGTGAYRWIDFDLTQSFTDFDVWSMGNILNFVVGQGKRTYHDVAESTEIADAIKPTIHSGDASAFFPYRIMNLRKIFPYIHSELGDILARFSKASGVFYESVAEMIDDLDRALDRWPNGGAVS